MIMLQKFATNVWNRKPIRQVTRERLFSIWNVLIELIMMLITQWHIDAVRREGGGNTNERDFIAITDSHLPALELQLIILVTGRIARNTWRQEIAHAKATLISNKMSRSHHLSQALCRISAERPGLSRSAFYKYEFSYTSLSFYCFALSAVFRILILVNLPVNNSLHWG